MSHLKERKEKICLNCTATLHGRFCHNCGQENTEPKESFLHLATHFFNDLTHFDGKFFTTVKYLLFRPGFLAAEYARGKRASYLNPIRMYIFTSAVFFLVFAFHFNTGEDKKKSKTTIEKNELRKIYYTTEDPVQRDSAHTALTKLDQKIDREKDVHAELNEEKEIMQGVIKNEAHDTYYYSVAYYDSVQAALAENQRDSWIERIFYHKQIELSKKYAGDNGEIWLKIVENIAHNISKGLIICLPLLALVLQFMYVRRRKEFYYVNHIMFVIDFTIAVYIILLSISFITKVLHWVHVDRPSGWFWFIGIISIFFYLYKAMRNFYKQGRGKIIFKYILFLFSFIFIFSFIVLLLFLTSAWLV